MLSTDVEESLKYIVKAVERIEQKQLYPHDSQVTYDAVARNFISTHDYQVTSLPKCSLQRYNITTLRAIQATHYEPRLSRWGNRYRDHSSSVAWFPSQQYSERCITAMTNVF